MIKTAKNSSNLCHRDKDFRISTEWNIFGKSPCDGIGGTVKCLVWKASLQTVSSNHILTQKDFYNWASTNITNITFMYITSEPIQRHEQTIRMRMSNAKTVSGSCSYHKFVTISELDLRMCRLSYDHTSIITPHTSVIGTTESQAQEAQDPNPRFIFWVGMTQYNFVFGI